MLNHKLAPSGPPVDLNLNIFLVLIELLVVKVYQLFVSIEHLCLSVFCVYQHLCLE